MKYIIIIILFSFSSLFSDEGNVYLYTEIYGPQESIIAPNIEVSLLKISNDFVGNGDLRVRGAIRITGLAFFSFYPSFMGGAHFVTSGEHKLDLGVNVLYQELSGNYVLNTGTSLSLNIGYRHNLDNNWFVGFSFCPTYGKENKPFYPASIKVGLALW